MSFRKLLAFIGVVAVSHPRTWINSFFLLGLITGITLHGAFGAWLGSLVGQTHYGFYLGLALYSMYMVTHMDEIDHKLEEQVLKLESMKELL